jgi:hypothetical protein
MKKFLIILFVLILAGGIVFAGLKVKNGEWNIPGMKKDQPQNINQNINQNETQIPVEDEYFDPTKPDFVISPVEFSFKPVVGTSESNGTN